MTAGPQYRSTRFARLARRPTAPVPPAAEALDTRQAALVSLIGSLPLRIIMTDRELRVLAASHVTPDGVKRVQNDFVGRTVFEIDPDYFAPFRVIAERCLTGETFSAPRVRGRQDDGPDVWLRTEISPWRNAKGEIAGLISVSIDITDMTQSLDASERSEQRLQMAVEIADLHVWELDYATQQMTTAGAASTFFDGSLSDEEIAADTNITIHPEDRARIAEDWRIAVENDLPFRPEYRINRADGKEVWAACTTRMVRNAAGQPTGLIGAMQNITERKRVEADLVQAKEEAEAANRAKSAFLATMSHEIRTPLNGVLGMAQAMAADELAPTQRDRLDTIRQSGEALLTVLNDILDLSKIEAGKLELEVVEFEVSGLANSTHDTFAGVAEGRALDLVVAVDDDARGRYVGDCGRLRQIIYNLVSNGLKFTEAGEVRLHVSRRDAFLVFTVSDTGIGIPAERMARLFNKFEQGDASTTRRFGGTGLGLAISRDLATLMGGDIEVESRDGAGSEFRLVVRLERVGDEIAIDPAASAAETGLEDGVSLRVLAAEDNSVNQLVLRTLLQQVGLDPHIVSDGAEAVAAWREQAWDVILMDVQMPVMDGPTATRTIRAAEAETGRPRTPILALTANAMAHQVAEYAAAGMDGFIAKPIKVEELFGALQGVVDAIEVSRAA